MTSLLDVNLLIALIDPAHVWHGRAQTWFATERRDGWATCPITENGVLRIMSEHSYPKTPSLFEVAEVLKGFRRLKGHEFWSDDISLFDFEGVQMEYLLRPKQVTDGYLLALACAHGGELVTFDRRIVSSVVSGGEKRLRVLI